ncbi:MAG: MFS transporter [Vicinamibacterales bacterium]
MPPPGGVRNLLRSLRHRNYRLFVAGQSVSLVGTWITRVATGWLVYRLTGSELLLGVVGFSGQIAMLVLSPMAGVIIDRYDRHKVMIWTQVLSLVQSGVLAVLTLSGVITVTHIIVLQLLQGVINSFDTPARQAFVVQMVDDRADLSNAIALNSTMVNGSRIAGPAIGGLIIAAVGEGWCFAVDSLSYAAVIWSLLAMRVAPVERAAHPVPLGEAFRTGFRYISEFAPVRAALTLVSLVSLFGMPYVVLMPAVASRVLGGTASTLGVLMAASGVGAVGGALYLASRTSVVGLGRHMALGTLTFGAALVAFALSRHLALSLAIQVVAGAGFMIALAATNTVIQTLVPEDLRGRVMAFYATAFLGMAPVGSLAAGMVAERAGTTNTILGGGAVCAAAGLWFLRALPELRAIVRPIYVERGILTVPVPPVEGQPEK